MRREAHVFVLAGDRKAVKQLCLGNGEGETKVESPEEILFSSVFQ